MLHALFSLYLPWHAFQAENCLPSTLGEPPLTTIPSEAFLFMPCRAKSNDAPDARQTSPRPRDLYISVHTCPPGRSPSSVMLNVCRLPTHPLAKASSCFVLAAAPAKRKTAGAVIDIGRCVGKARVRLPQLASAAGCHCQSAKCPPGEGLGVPFAALRRPSQDRQLEYLE
ncbi:DUF3854 domain protein [Metarhizium robertsii]|uniref:DUF3854 domain protein n=1 Tax=Metarhizium robertsii TaxID=568076 RepID=A0A0A1UVP5_9HYPO|nr:DUF3854 domain protein [Metarhizium robertsii]